MTLWLIAAGLSLLCVVVLLYAPRPSASVAPGDSRLAVYKAQLAELERDVARGVLAPAEAEQQRIEVSRRLLAAARESTASADTVPRALGLAAILCVPLLALFVYATVGAPGLADLPQAERLAAAQDTGDLDALVYKVERHLAQHPDDATGWQLLLPSYNAMGRFDASAEAYRQLLRIKGPSAESQAGLAEALTMANNRLVPPEAAKAAAAALALDAKHPKARYFAALGLAQDNRPAEALAAFKSLLADAPADAPWKQSVERQIADLEKGVTHAPALTDEQMANGTALDADGQNAMITGMVDGLAAKLAANPNDLQGWLRLIRARTVLQQKDVAEAALATARQTFAADPAALQSLQSLATELSLQ